jgi:hypothetical protein
MEKTDESWKRSISSYDFSSAVDLILALEIKSKTFPWEFTDWPYRKEGFLSVFIRKL